MSWQNVLISISPLRRLVAPVKVTRDQSDQHPGPGHGDGQYTRWQLSRRERVEQSGHFTYNTIIHDSKWLTTCPFFVKENAINITINLLLHVYPFDLFTIIVGLTWPHQNAFLSTTSESFELPQSFQIIHEKISKKAKCTTWWNSQMATQKARKIRMSQHNPSLNLHLLHFLDFIFYFYVWTFIISFIFSLFSNKNDKLLFKNI